MGYMPSRIWAQQPSVAPEIDWSNPLARGLSSLLWAGHGKAFDLLAPSEVITVTNAPLSASVNGIGRQVTTAGSNGVFSARSGVPAAKIAALPLSFFFVGEIGTAAGSAPIAGYTSGTNGYLIHAAYGSRTRRIYCSGVNTESGTWSAGQGVFGIVANGSTLVGYDKGNQFASTACSSAPSYDSFSRYQMFGSSDTGSVTGTGLFQAAWSRALSPAEVKSFSSNPWQIFKPLQKSIFASIASGGNIGLSVQKSTHAHTSDHVSTSFSTLLPINDATHGLTSDQLALALLSILSIAESTHSHASDGVSLTVSGVASLSISDGQHAHIADGVVVSTNWLLAISDAIHGHLPDGIILDTSNAAWLSIQEVAHGHACDSLSLSTQAWISIVDAAHAHLADSPTIYSGQFALQVAETLHSVSSDAPYLSLPGGALVSNPRYIVKAIARQMMVKASSRNNTVKR